MDYYLRLSNILIYHITILHSNQTLKSGTVFRIIGGVNGQRTLGLSGNAESNGVYKMT